MAQTMNKDLEAIRHFAGTVADFKNFFDQKAAETAKKDEAETNAYGTPQYQGFNDVHPTRGANASPHWEESVNLEEKKGKYPNPFKKGDKITVTNVGGPDGKRFNGKKGIVNHIQGDYVSVKLKAFSSSDIEFYKGEVKLDESLKVAPRSDKAIKDLEKQGSEINYLDDADAATKKIWKKAGINPDDQNTVILYSYVAHPWEDVKNILTKHSIDFKELEDPNSAGESMIVFIEESNSTSTKADRLPLFEDFQG